MKLKVNPTNVVQATNTGNNPFKILGWAWNHPVQTAGIGGVLYAGSQVADRAIDDYDFNQELQRRQDLSFLKNQQDQISYQNMMNIIGRQLDNQYQIAKLGLPAYQSQIDRQFVNDVLSSARSF